MKFKVHSKLSHFKMKCWSIFCFSCKIICKFSSVGLLCFSIIQQSWCLLKSHHSGSHIAFPSGLLPKQCVIITTLDSGSIILWILTSVPMAFGELNGLLLFLLFSRVLNPCLPGLLLCSFLIHINLGLFFFLCLFNFILYLTF